jgi:hypothetical protein
MAKSKSKKWKVVVGGSKRAQAKYTKTYASKSSARAAMRRIKEKRDMGVSTIFLIDAQRLKRDLKKGGGHG